MLYDIKPNNFKFDLILFLYSQNYFILIMSLISIYFWYNFLKQLINHRSLLISCLR